jgi:hypothetical protein
LGGIWFLTLESTLSFSETSVHPESAFVLGGSVCASAPRCRSLETNYV